MQKLKSGIKSKFESDLARYIFYNRRFEKGLKWVLLITYIVIHLHRLFVRLQRKKWRCMIGQLTQMADGLG